jgi:hypothetical protein
MPYCFASAGTDTGLGSGDDEPLFAIKPLLLFYLVAALMQELIAALEIEVLW